MKKQRKSSAERKTEEKRKEEKERKERERKKKEKEAWIRLQEARIVKGSTISAGENSEWSSFLLVLLLISLLFGLNFDSKVKLLWSDDFN